VAVKARKGPTAQRRGLDSHRATVEHNQGPAMGKMRANDLSPSNGKRISADRGPVCAATQPMRQPRPLRYRLERQFFARPEGSNPAGGTTVFAGKRYI
jgi:hypothetical protein